MITKRTYAFTKNVNITKIRNRNGKNPVTIVFLGTPLNAANACVAFYILHFFFLQFWDLNSGPSP
jgi:hypothetical protein